MTFQVIDRDIQERESVTVLRCECGGIETVYDQPDDDRAVDEAERIHVHIPRCIACLEPVQVDELLDDDPNAIPVCRICYMDDPQGVRESIMAFMLAQEKVA